MSQPPALLLAGGRATRLGGGDKPLRMLGGKTLLERLAARLAPQCSDLLLSVGGGDTRRFGPAWAGATVADAPEDSGAGPLAGLLAGLDRVAARDGTSGVLLTVPADTPFVPPDLAARLAGARAPGGVAYACSGGREHPLVALWPVAGRDTVRRALREEGTRRVRAVLGRFDAVAVEWPVETVDPFFNINEPRDLDRASSLLAQIEEGGAMQHIVTRPLRSTDSST